MFARIVDTFNHWCKGVRVYVALATTLITLEAWWWAYAQFAGSNLYAIRLQEAYGWLSVTFLIVAISIGPFCKLFPNNPVKRQLFDSRRMFGIGAAWFAGLHVVISYGALFKFANPVELPSNYQQAFLIGSLAFLILLAMVATSYDKALKKLGVWWFRLHRLVYAAVFLIMLHMMLIGAHATAPVMLMVQGLLGGGLLASHIYLASSGAKRPSRWQLITLSGAVVLFIAILAIGITQPGTTVSGSYT